MTLKSLVAVGIVGTATCLVGLGPPAPEDAKVQRIQAHFDSVLVELRERDVRALSTEQKARRALLVDTLMAYRNRGVFPHNYDFAQPTPYFVDRKTGVLCAVAHLLASTGRRDIVDRVAAADNNVWVPELAGDTAFRRWLDVNGITLAEAARIQVPYIGDDPPVGVVAQRDDRMATLPIATAMLATVVGTANLTLNGDGHSRLGNILGLASGAASAGVGVAMMSNPREDRALALTSAAVGTVSALIAARGFQRHRQALAARRAAERSVAVAPLIPTSESGPGLSVNVRF
jgi:hypothetical protein